MKNKGFSMVELIIVIAIMSILAGFLAPSLVKYIAKSRLSADIDTGRTLATAIQSAIADESAREDAVDQDIPSKISQMQGPKFKAAVSQIVAVDDIEGKSKKDANGDLFPDPSFFYALDPEKNRVEIYYGGTDDDYMIYPAMGSKLVQ